MRKTLALLATVTCKIHAKTEICFVFHRIVTLFCIMYTKIQLWHTRTPAHGCLYSYMYLQPKEYNPHSIRIKSKKAANTHAQNHRSYYILQHFYSKWCIYYHKSIPLSVSLTLSLIYNCKIYPQTASILRYSKKA